MAQMFPTTIPDHIRRDIYRSSEINIFERLATQLPNSYVCYYSRPWLGLLPDGEEKDGEADFVIAHPDFGMLVIEVKGGRISRREGDEQWLSTDRHGITYRIKDPVAQARSSKYQLLKKLKEEKSWKTRFITVRHAVILPNSSKPKNGLGTDAPLDIFAFGDDLDNLKEWVEQRFFTTDDKAHGSGLGVDGMSALHKLLSVSFELRPNLSIALAEDSKKIERLTMEQSMILESLDGNPQMGIAGGAGTGKTLLALEKAHRASETGMRTLLVCYNKALGLHLESFGSNQSNLDIGSFHSICGKLASKAKISVVTNIQTDLYDSILPDALIDAVDTLPILKYDAIIVDEGQDFGDNWLTALRLCLNDMEEGLFYIFYDDNQRIYDNQGALLSQLPSSLFRLNKNLRNTRAIHKTLVQWYGGKPILSAGPKGIPVQWIACKDKYLQSEITKIVRDLVQHKQLAIEDIAILTSISIEKSFLGKLKNIAGYGIQNITDNKKDFLVCDTVRRFKGLEKKCIILVDINQLLEPELIYVALSRASVLLYVLGNPPDLKHLDV